MKLVQPLQHAEQKMSCWRGHFQEVLNVDSFVNEEVVANLESYIVHTHAHTHTHTQARTHTPGL